MLLTFKHVHRKASSVVASSTAILKKNILLIQNLAKRKKSDEPSIANKELVFQNEETKKRHHVYFCFIKIKTLC